LFSVVDKQANPRGLLFCVFDGGVMKRPSDSDFTTADEIAIPRA
jgi:hypothetical protein